MSSDHRERGFLDPRTPWTDECDVVEGLRPSFRHGLHGAVGMIFYAHAVYVVICYMSIICSMPVICLVQNPPQEVVVVFGYIEGHFC